MNLYLVIGVTMTLIGLVLLRNMPKIELWKSVKTWWAAKGKSEHWIRMIVIGFLAVCVLAFFAQNDMMVKAFHDMWSGVMNIFSSKAIDAQSGANMTSVVKDAPSDGTNLLVTIAVATIVFVLVYMGLARETKFSLREKMKLGSLGNGTIIPDFIKTRWNKKDEGGKRWTGYVLVAVLTVSISLIVSMWTKDEKNGLMVGGTIALIGLHIVWGALSSKTGLFTKVIISGFLIFYVLGFIFPDEMITIRDAGKDVSKTFAKDVASGSQKLATTYANSGVPKTAAVSGIPSPAKKEAWQYVIVKAAQATYTRPEIPGGHTAEDKSIPANVVNISPECPPGVEMVVVATTPIGAERYRNDVADCSKLTILPSDLLSLGKVQIGFRSQSGPQDVKFWYVPKS